MLYNFESNFENREREKLATVTVTSLSSPLLSVHRRRGGRTAPGRATNHLDVLANSLPTPPSSPSPIKGHHRLPTSLSPLPLTAGRAPPADGIGRNHDATAPQLLHTVLQSSCAPSQAACLASGCRNSSRPPFFSMTEQNATVRPTVAASLL